jgi:hypothetical protein
MKFLVLFAALTAIAALEGECSSKCYELSIVHIHMQY